MWNAAPMWRCGMRQEILDLCVCVFVYFLASLLLYHCIYRRWLGYKAIFIVVVWRIGRIAFSYKAKSRKGTDRRNKETEINISLIPLFSAVLLNHKMGKVLSRLEGWKRSR